MSMIASFFRISEDLLQQIKANPDEIEDILDASDEIEENELDIDKSWHGISFLLSGNPALEVIPTGIGRAILGGTEIGDDLGNGPIRYHEPNEVRAISAELERITTEEFASRYNIAELSSRGIYPMHKKWSPDDKDYLVDNYDMLRIYYQTAAANEQAMLILIG